LSTADLNGIIVAARHLDPEYFFVLSRHKLFITKKLFLKISLKCGYGKYRAVRSPRLPLRVLFRSELAVLALPFTDGSQGVHDRQAASGGAGQKTSRVSLATGVW